MKLKIFCSIKGKRVFAILRPARDNLFSKSNGQKTTIWHNYGRNFLDVCFNLIKDYFFFSNQNRQDMYNCLVYKEKQSAAFAEKNVNQQIFEQKIQDLWFQNWLLGSREKDICFCIFFVWTLKYCIHTYLKSSLE